MRPTLPPKATRATASARSQFFTQNAGSSAVEIADAIIATNPGPAARPSATQLIDFNESLITVVTRFASSADAVNAEPIPSTIAFPAADQSTEES